jgi:hypothetical protein
LVIAINQPISECAKRQCLVVHFLLRHRSSFLVQQFQNLD